MTAFWWAAGIFAVLAMALIGAVSYWGPPDWVPIEQPTFAGGFQEQAVVMATITARDGDIAGIEADGGMAAVLAEAGLVEQHVVQGMVGQGEVVRRGHQPLDPVPEAMGRQAVRGAPCTRSRPPRLTAGPARK